MIYLKITFKFLTITLKRIIFHVFQIPVPQCFAAKRFLNPLVSKHNSNSKDFQILMVMKNHYQFVIILSFNLLFLKVVMPNTHYCQRSKLTHIRRNSVGSQT